MTISHWSRVAAQGDSSLTFTLKYDAWWLQIEQPHHSVQEGPGQKLRNVR